MLESTGHQMVQRRLSDVTKWGMTKVVSQRDGLCQVLIETQAACKRARYLSYLERVGQTRTIMVAHRGQKYLRFVFETAKAFAVDNAVAVTLVAGAHVVLGNRMRTSCTFS